MIKKTHQLTQRELNQLKQLMTLCSRVDGSSPNIYPHLLSQRRMLPASNLYYNKQQQLVAFLSAYFFYDDACEIALMVLPLFRKKGIAKKLIAEVIPLLLSQRLSRMIFSSPGKKNVDWFKKHDFTYMHTEYHMLRTSKHKVDPQKYAHMDIREATQEMIPLLCTLDEICFPKEHTDNPTHFRGLLNNTEEYQLFAVFLDNKLVGKAHLRWSGKTVTFSDIAIFPEMQNKGLGRALLAFIINYSIAKGKTRLVLDVEAKNERALKIYQNFDFAIQNTADYWSIGINEISRILGLDTPEAPP